MTEGLSQFCCNPSAIYMASLAAINPKSVIRNSANFFQSYIKSRAIQNKSHLFFLPSQSNFAVIHKVTKKREQNKTNRFVFLPSAL